MRVYGGTTAPEDPTAYTLLHVVGDMVELVKHLGENQAVIVGHDWGAPAAWNAAMLRPDVFRAVVGMSVPFSPPGPVNLLDGLKKAGIETFYMQYFQTPGVAEKELERDVATSIRRINFNGSGDGPDRIAFGVLQPGRSFLDDLSEPEFLPSWLTPEDIAYYVAEFSRTGFRGGLNWYRNITRSWELLAPWRGVVIQQPSISLRGRATTCLNFPTRRRRLPILKTRCPGCGVVIFLKALGTGFSGNVRRLSTTG
ncbi:alpha/beta fold hydrolase [Bradyrhizobium sp. GCM10023182]|uniref:alpha/beta fold hydrolase n=1 Tax=Bradyrhizobium TaxID=374 RepID=UPI0030B82EBD